MKQFKGLFFAIISSATFGMIPLFALPALKAGVNLESVLFYRFAISAVAIGILLALRGTSFHITLREGITLFGLGVMYALTALFLTSSYLYVPSGIATTLHFLYPVIVTTIMILFFRYKVSRPLFFAALLAIGGVYLLCSTQSGGPISLRGIGMVLITVITYASYIVGINKSCVREMDGLKMTFFVLLSSTMVFVTNLFIHGRGLSVIPDISTGINLFMLALVPTLVSDLTLILAIQQIGSTTTAILGCMEPVTAVLLGVLFLGESFGVFQLAGVLIILLAVFIVIIDSNKDQFVGKSKWITFLFAHNRS